MRICRIVRHQPSIVSQGSNKSRKTNSVSTDFSFYIQQPPPATSAPVATIPPPFLNPGSMIVLKLIIHPRPSLPKKRKKYMS
jgi:hypothetical protein